MTDRHKDGTVKERERERGETGRENECAKQKDKREGKERR